MNPYPFQETGALWLRSRHHALLADEMGLGKTIQAILAARALDVRSVLVVCPASVRSVWEREWATWWPDGPKPDILSYDTARAHPDRTQGPYELLVADEAHYLKAPTAARTAAVLGRLGIVHRAARTWLLTGTPMPNHAGEMWPWLATFGFTSLSYDDWVHRYCTGYWHSGRYQITGTRADRMGELRGLIQQSGATLRRTRAEVLPDLPTATLTTITISPDEIEEPEEIREALEVDRARIRAAFARGESEVSLEALAPTVPTLRRWNALRKLEPLSTLLADELDRNEYAKIVVFGCHRCLVEGLAERLKSFGVVCIHGGVEACKRGSLVQRFQTDPRVRVFVGNTLAAGTGLTLHAAHHVILADLDWVPASNQQALSRVVRIGQRENVFVRVVELADSLDQRISAILSRKLREISELWR